jgi:hypothetical protein
MRRPLRRRRFLRGAGERRGRWARGGGGGRAARGGGRRRRRRRLPPPAARGTQGPPLPRPLPQPYRAHLSNPLAARGAGPSARRDRGRGSGVWGGRGEARCGVARSRICLRLQLNPTKKPPAKGGAILDSDPPRRRAGDPFPSPAGPPLRRDHALRARGRTGSALPRCRPAPAAPAALPPPPIHRCPRPRPHRMHGPLLGASAGMRHAERCMYGSRVTGHGVRGAAVVQAGRWKREARGGRLGGPGAAALRGRMGRQKGQGRRSGASVKRRRSEGPLGVKGLSTSGVCSRGSVSKTGRRRRGGSSV